MSNHAWLLAIDRLPKEQDDDLDDGEVLGDAVYLFPVFWVMLFDESSMMRIDRKGGPWDGDESYDFHVPHCCRSTTEAIAAAKARWPTVATAIGSQYAELFQVWLKFITSKKRKYVVCDLRELEYLGEELKACLKAMTDGQPIKDSLVWRSALHHIGGWDEDSARFEGVHALCGSGFGELSPWDSGEFDHLFPPPAPRTHTTIAAPSKAWWQFWRR